MRQAREREEQSLRERKPAIVMLSEKIERPQRAGLEREPELRDQVPFVPIETSRLI